MNERPRHDSVTRARRPGAPEDAPARPAARCAAALQAGQLHQARRVRLRRDPVIATVISSHAISRSSVQAAIDPPDGRMPAGHDANGDLQEVARDRRGAARAPTRGSARDPVRRRRATPTSDGRDGDDRRPAAEHRRRASPNPTARARGRRPLSRTCRQCGSRDSQLRRERTSARTGAAQRHASPAANRTALNARPDGPRGRTSPRRRSTTRPARDTTASTGSARAVAGCACPARAAHEQHRQRDDEEQRGPATTQRTLARGALEQAAASRPAPSATTLPCHTQFSTTCISQCILRLRRSAS